MVNFRRFLVFMVSANNCPSAVWLFAGMTGRSLGHSADVDPLTVIGATESVGIVEVILDAEIPIMSRVRIAPLVERMLLSGIEPIVISPVRVTAVFAVEISGKRGAERAPEDHARNRGAGAPVVIANGV